MSTDTATKSKMSRVPTGVPRLDFLLKGGLFQGAVYVVQGFPGLGKTILANQCVFESARNDRPALFFSLLAESTGRIVGYLESFKFADPSLIGTKIEYASGYQALKEKGPEGLLDLIKKAVTSKKIKFLVIDGLDSVETVATDPVHYREFIHSLQAFASLTNCTTLLLTPANPVKEGLPRPEYAISDGVIELSEHQVGPRAIREIQVLKFRGSDFLKGKHEIEITNSGVLIHPRTEIQFGRTPAVDKTKERVRMKFGIPRFDEMTNGGVFSGSMTTVIGAPGTGKTTMGLSFLAEGAKVKQPGIYLGFYETKEELIEKATNVGIPIKKAVEAGLVEIQWQQAVENITDALAETLLERIREKKSAKIRVFIDGMAGFRKSLAYPERFEGFISALTNELRNVGATTIYSEETDLFGSDVNLRDRALASVVDNVFYLRYVELRSQLYRLISILKMRASAYDSAIREFAITAKGVVVSDSFKSAESILTGTARLIASRPASKRSSGRKK